MATVDHLKVGAQPQADNSDKLDQVTALIQEIAESGDMAALLQVVSYANQLALRQVR